MKVEIKMLERMNVEDFMKEHGLSLSITEQYPTGDDRFKIKVNGIKQSSLHYYPIGIVFSNNIVSGMTQLFSALSNNRILLESNPNDRILVPVLTWTKSQIDSWERLV